MPDDENHEFSVAAQGTKKIKWLEACEYGVVDAVKELLEEDPELLNFQDNLEADGFQTGHSGLHKACLRGKLEVVKYLLEKGADPNLDDALLKTCLHIAAATYKDDETGDFDFEGIVDMLPIRKRIGLRRFAAKHQTVTCNGLSRLIARVVNLVAKCGTYRSAGSQLSVPLS